MAGTDGPETLEHGNSYLRDPHPIARPPIPIRRWLLLLACGLLVYEFVFSSHGFLTLRRLNRQATALEERRVDREAEKTALIEKRRRIESGEALEEVAREEHGYARPGEEIYVLPAPEEAAAGR